MRCSRRYTLKVIYGQVNFDLIAVFCFLVLPRMSIRNARLAVAVDETSPAKIRSATRPLADRRDGNFSGELLRASWLADHVLDILGLLFEDALWVRTAKLSGPTTFNPWWGCLKVSPACKHCYAES